MIEYDKRKVSIKEIVDTNTGEVIRHEKRFVKNVKSEEFIKVYLEDMSGLMQIKGDVELKVLLWIWKLTSWNNTEIVLEKSRKELIASKTGLKVQSISDALTRLVKKEILVKSNRMFYSLNPKFFFKGEDSARKEVYNVNIEYNVNKTNV